MTRFLLLSILILSSAALAQPPGGGPGGGPGGASGDGIWRRNAYYGEGQSFDSCVGHQPGQGDYHYHANPLCLRFQLGDNLVVLRSMRTGKVYAEKPAPWTPSPILGWALDGFPIYGPYGYSDPTDARSAVKRLKSGFRLRDIAQRTSLPDWSLPNHMGVSQQLTTAQYGPDVSIANPLGRYNEDYEWVAGVGDLDRYNGRLEINSDYPNGTYAYRITIDDNGNPAWPFILAGQYYGSTTGGGRANTIPGDAVDYFNSGNVTAPAVTTPLLSSWYLKDSTTSAVAVSGYDPGAGPTTTWPTNIPTGATYSGGVTTATNGGPQRIRYNTSTVYMNSSGLAGGYTMGPWFDPSMNGGVFSNFPANQNFQFGFNRDPAAATAKPSTGGGDAGIWVNGVSLFNFIDGASYSTANKADSGGPAVRPAIVTVSAASGENGPLAPGSFAAAYTIWGSVLSTSTATATTADWPTTLGGATVTVKDAAGITRNATIYYASPAQVNYRIPVDSASGFATATVIANGSSYSSGINILASYPHLFIAPDATAVGYAIRVVNGVQTVEPITGSIDVGTPGDRVFLVLFGSGLGTATTSTATVNGTIATVAYAGPQGNFGGLDQYNVALQPSLAGAGRIPVTLTVGSRPSNTVYVTVR